MPDAYAERAGGRSRGGRAAPGCRSRRRSGRASASTSSACAGAAGRVARAEAAGAPRRRSLEPLGRRSAPTPTMRPDRRPREHRRARARLGPGVGRRGRRGAGQRLVRRMRVRDLRLHFVNTTGTATSLDRLRKTVRGVVAGAASAIARPGRRRRSAQTAPPAIVSREEWGGDGVPAARRPRLRRGEARVHPPHRERERLRAGGLRRDGARHLPLPPQLERLERHRLQLPRRPLRHDLRGPRGRHRPRRWSAPRRRATTASRPGISSLGTFSTAGQTRRRACARSHACSRWKLGGARRAADRQGRRSCPGAARRTATRPGRGRHVRAHLGPPRRQRTACPGNGLYAQLPQLRAMVGARPAARATTATRCARRAATSPTAEQGRDLSSALAELAGDAAGRTARRTCRCSAALGWRTHALRQAPTRPGRPRRACGCPTTARLRARFAGETGAAAVELREPVGVGVRPRVTVDARRAARWRPGERGARHRHACARARRTARADRQAPHRSGGSPRARVAHASLQAAVAATAASTTLRLARAGRATGCGSSVAARRAQPGGALRSRRASGVALTGSGYSPAGGRQPPRLAPVEPLAAEQQPRRLQPGCAGRGAATSARCTRGRARSARATAARRGPLTCAQPGDARLHREPAELARRVLLDLHAHGRARADDAHVARQHVDEVRQLVQREPAQQRAHARDARVALVDREAGSHAARRRSPSCAASAGRSRAPPLPTRRCR